VFFARADGTTLRLLYLSASDGSIQTPLGLLPPRIFGNRPDDKIGLARLEVALGHWKGDGGVGRKTTRKPLLLLRLFGLLLLRTAARALS